VLNIISTCSHSSVLTTTAFLEVRTHPTARKRPWLCSQRANPGRMAAPDASSSSKSSLTFTLATIFACFLEVLTLDCTRSGQGSKFRSKHSQLPLALRKVARCGDMHATHHFCLYPTEERQRGSRTPRSTWKSGKAPWRDRHRCRRVVVVEVVV
jgi:hypothetical protein